MTIAIEDLIKCSDEIPALPFYVSKILEAINDPEANTDDIANLISKDIGLTTKILKLVNSPYFGLPAKVTTISHALSIIGLSPIGTLVLASTLMSQFKNIPENYVTMESFWSHSIASGIAAKEICKLKKLKNGESLYIAGIIHDIGSLVIYKKYPEKAHEALIQCNEYGQGLIDSEQKFLGFDHAQLGSALIEKWNLPKLIQETTEFHHQPLNAPTYKKETAIVNLADYIIHSNQLGSSGELRGSDLNKDILKLLELSMDDLALVSEKTIQNFDEIYKALKNT